MNIRYRPEIDGLRTLAVLSVILYHAQIIIFNFEPFRGGYIGVDIFFVISGYLITSIILRELIDKGSFSFKNFYKKRVRRILPALLFVILVSIPFSWLYLFPTDLLDYSKSILYSLGFASNFFFHFSGLEYGSPEGLLKPFLHTWSLSVEEQFYILFPIILFCVFKYFKKYLIHTFIIYLVFSLCLADWGSKNFPSSTFYLLHSRIWELICGSLVAYFEIKKGYRCKNNLMSQTFPLFGLLLIIFSVFFFNDTTFHPSFYTLIPVSGVIMILWFSNENEIVTKILSIRIFVGIGLISYSLYLWHYPIFSFAKNLEFFFDSNVEKFILIILSVILSVLSYHFVEQPARKGTSFAKVSSIMIIMISFIFIYVSLSILNNGFDNRLKVKNYQKKHSYMYLTQNGKPCFNRSKNFCNFGQHNKKIILLGDSHMGSLSYNLYNRVKNDYSFQPITLAGYFHLRNVELVKKKN